MKRLRFSSIFVAVIACTAALGLSSQQSSAGDKAKTYSKETVERGEYLVIIGGCHDCHSPKVFESGMPMPDPTRILSGHPADAKLPPFDPAQVPASGWVMLTMDLTACVGPWGITYAANLTPDDATGTGLWTEEVFISALRTGKHMGKGRPIMPPMPWFNLKEATDEDLQAIYAYLRTIPPVSNQVPGFQTLEQFAGGK